MKASKRSKHAKPISYKPAQVARRRTDTIAGSIPESPAPRKASPPGGSIACQPPADGMDRMLLMIPPGTQYTFTFLGAHGKITLSYPLDGSPQAKIDMKDPEKPVRVFYFARCPEFLELVEGAEEGQG